MNHLRSISEYNKSQDYILKIVSDIKNETIDIAENCFDLSQDFLDDSSFKIKIGVSIGNEFTTTPIYHMDESGIMDEKPVVLPLSWNREKEYDVIFEFKFTSTIGEYEKFRESIDSFISKVSKMYNYEFVNMFWNTGDQRNPFWIKIWCKLN